MSDCDECRRGFLRAGSGGCGGAPRAGVRRATTRDPGDGGPDEAGDGRRRRVGDDGGDGGDGACQATCATGAKTLAVHLRQVPGARRTSAAAPPTTRRATPTRRAGSRHHRRPADGGQYVALLGRVLAPVLHGRVTAQEQNEFAVPLPRRRPSTRREGHGRTGADGPPEALGLRRRLRGLRHASPEPSLQPRNAAVSRGAPAPRVRPEHRLGHDHRDLPRSPRPRAPRARRSTSPSGSSRSGWPLMFFMAGGNKLAGNPQMVGLFDVIGIGQWFRYVTGALEVTRRRAPARSPRDRASAPRCSSPSCSGAITTHLVVLHNSPAMPLRPAARRARVRGVGPPRRVSLSSSRERRDWAERAIVAGAPAALMNGLDLNDVATFVRVAEGGGFTAAATALGVPKSTVSRALARLEQHLGVRLVQRTTRAAGADRRGPGLLRARARRGRRASPTRRPTSSTWARSRAARIRITAPVDIGQVLLAEVVAQLRREVPAGALRGVADVARRRPGGARGSTWPSARRRCRFVAGRAQARGGETRASSRRRRTSRGAARPRRPWPTSRPTSSSGFRATAGARSCLTGPTGEERVDGARRHRWPTTCSSSSASSPRARASASLPLFFAGVRDARRARGLRPRPAGLVAPRRARSHRRAERPPRAAPRQAVPRRFWSPRPGAGVRPRLRPRRRAGDAGAIVAAHAQDGRPRHGRQRRDRPLAPADARSRTAATTSSPST